MVTDWSRSGTRWDRPWTRPLRLAWLAALLLGLVYMHGVSGESVMAHAVPGPGPAVSMDDCTGPHESDGSAAQAGPGDAGHHHGDHGSSHPVQECVAGQPQDGPGPAAPITATTQRERASPAAPLPGIVPAGVAESVEPAARASTETTVLRI